MANTDTILALSVIVLALPVAASPARLLQRPSPIPPPRGPLRLPPKEDPRRQKHRRDRGIRKPHAQIPMVHRQRRVQEPNRGAEVPDGGFEIPAHSLMGCAHHGRMPPLRLP